jgi:hypothetical protein
MIITAEHIERAARQYDPGVFEIVDRGQPDPDVDPMAYAKYKWAVGAARMIRYKAAGILFAAFPEATEKVA